MKRFFIEPRYFSNFFKKNWYFEIDDSLLEKLFYYYSKSDTVCRMINSITFKFREDKEKYKEENMETMKKLFKVCNLEVNLKQFEKECFMTIEGETNYNGLFEEKFLAECFDLTDKKGLYFLFNDKKELIYIGKSCNLGSRIQDSSKDRRAVYLKYCLIENDSDLHILEIYFINVFKPIKNSDSKGKAPPTLKINYELKFDKDFIKIFKGDVNFGL